MLDRKTFQAEEQEALWTQIKLDFAAKQDFLNYEAILKLAGTKTYFAIDIDLGGGFQGGISTTNFKAIIQADPNYAFAIHDETFLDGVGKFFGMQDIIIGYPEFDELLIVKTDDEVAIKQIFADKNARIVIQKLKNFYFHLEHHRSSASTLNLVINEGITDIEHLKTIHMAFVSVLSAIENP